MAAAKVLAPVELELSDLTDVASIIQGVQAAASNTNYAYIADGALRIVHCDTQDTLGTLVIRGDGDEYTFVPGSKQ